MEHVVEQKKIKIKGVEYTLQMVEAKWYIDMVEACKAKGQLDTSKYMTQMLANVVVVPRLSLADFTGKIGTLKVLIKEAEKFINGDEPEVEEVEKND